MRFSFRWLKSYVEIDADPKEVAERLTMAGLEVETVEDRYPHLKGVVAVKITKIDKHPKADKLQICLCHDGSREYRVVCGAPNVSEGIVVPLVLPGTILPSGNRIQEVTIRGERSHGMLTSEKELELGDDASGLLILPDDTPLGQPLDKALGIEDYILEVAITPNRGDCLSVLGIAREVSALFGTALKYPEIELAEEGPSVFDVAQVVIEDADKCPRYTARVLFDVKIGPSPKWMRDRLESAGVRSINNIVDVTNYVMLEMGQPLHAFDYDRLTEHKIVVKCAHDGERFVTIDGQERTLFSDTLLICDGGGPVAIGGVMGGENSEIGEDTKHVLIESAWFNPSSIRRTSKKLHLSTESSYRFERGVDPEGVVTALNRAAQLMMETAGGKLAKGIIDVYPRPYKRPVLNLRIGKTNTYLGTNFSRQEMADALTRLEMDVKVLDNDTLEVVPPSFRLDITREVDLTEEVARILGYDNIPTAHPQTVVLGHEKNEHLRLRDELKNFLRGTGCREIITYSFISQISLKKLGLEQNDIRLNPIKLLNPLSEEQAVMRTSLVPGILNIVRYNLDRENENLRLFELSKVFIPEAGQNLGDPLPDERFNLVVALVGRRGQSELYDYGPFDYTDIKGFAEAIMEFFRVSSVKYLPGEADPYMDPVISAGVFVGEERVGVVGRINPLVAEEFDIEEPVWLLELDFEKLFKLRGPEIRFVPLPKYPFVARDLAIVVDEEFPVQEVIDFLKGLNNPLLERVEIFDIFRSDRIGKGKKSVGYRLIYRERTRSLTDEEVNKIHDDIARKLVEHFGVKFR